MQKSVHPQQSVLDSVLEHVRLPHVVFVHRINELAQLAPQNEVNLREKVSHIHVFPVHGVVTHCEYPLGHAKYPTLSYEDSVRLQGPGK